MPRSAWANTGASCHASTGWETTAEGRHRRTSWILLLVPRTIPEVPDWNFSSLERFFATIDPRSLPVVRGEILHHARGCYSAHSGIKRANRHAENLLIAAEKLASIAHVQRFLPYPKISRTPGRLSFSTSSTTRSRDPASRMPAATSSTGTVNLLPLPEGTWTLPFSRSPGGSASRGTNARFLSLRSTPHPWSVRCLMELTSGRIWTASSACWIRRGIRSHFSLSGTGCSCGMPCGSPSSRICRPWGTPCSGSFG